MIQINLLLQIATRRVSFCSFRPIAFNRLPLQGKLTLRRFGWVDFWLVKFETAVEIIILISIVPIKITKLNYRELQMSQVKQKRLNHI